LLDLSQCGIPNNINLAKYSMHCTHCYVEQNPIASINKKQDFGFLREQVISSNRWHNKADGHPERRHHFNTETKVYHIAAEGMG